MLDPGGLPRLQELAQATIAELVAEVCDEAEVEPSSVYEVAIAGNATMIQLLLGIDPEPLGVAPFILASRTYPGLMAADIGLEVHPFARVVVLPALGAYVGGDIIAGALASGMDRDKRLRLFIDVGTNCEIVIGDGTPRLTVTETRPSEGLVIARCERPGAIGPRKGIFLTYVQTPTSPLSISSSLTPGGLRPVLR